MRDETEIDALALLGADPDIREIAALEKLRRAAKVAPLARSLTEKQRARKLRTESGAVVTHGEILDAQLRRDHIEIDIQPLSQTEEIRVMARRGLSVDKILEALGEGAPSRATVGRVVHTVLGRRRAARGKVKGLSPRQASRKRDAEAMATPCAGGCGGFPSLRTVRARVHTKKKSPWLCQKCSGKSRRTRERVAAGTVCAGYDGPCNVVVSAAGRRQRGAAGPWLCQKCATRRAQASLSGAALARARSGYRDWWASLSEEQRQAERAKRAKPRKTKP